MKTNVRFIVKVLMEIFLTAIVMLLATKIFKGFYIRNFGFAFLASAILMLLNVSIKPFLKLITLPFNILTLGIFTPLIDVILLKLIGLVIQGNFVIEGWLSAFFVAIFIGIMTFILDKFITKEI